MGDRTHDRNPAQWESSVGDMLAIGASVYIACTSRGCQKPSRLSLEQLVAKFGADFSLWDRRAVCPHCGHVGHYMASPSRGTPYRPLRSGVEAAAKRQLWLSQFSFSVRDRLRIQAMAERVTRTWSPPPLRDLDVPFVVGACWPGDEFRSSGSFLGHWNQMTLLYWPMNDAEREPWAKRPRGPRPI